MSASDDGRWGVRYGPQIGQLTWKTRLVHYVVYRRSLIHKYNVFTAFQLSNLIYQLRTVFWRFDNPSLLAYRSSHIILAASRILLLALVHHGTKQAVDVQLVRPTELIEPKSLLNWWFRYISLVGACCMMLMGYDSSVYNSVQGSNNWRAYFNNPVCILSMLMKDPQLTYPEPALYRFDQHNVFCRWYRCRVVLRRSFRMYLLRPHDQLIYHSPF